MVRSLDRATGTVRTHVDPTYKHRPNVLMLRAAGKDVAITFNEHNPQALRLAEAMKNLDVGDLHVVLNLTAKATRWFASVNTQYNPIFGVVNFLRDVQTGVLNLSTTPLAGAQRQVLARVPAAMRAIYRATRDKTPTDRQWAGLWAELQEVGGTTGYRDLFADAADRSKALERELAALDRGAARRAAVAIVDWLSDYNETMENAVRLAAYKVALDRGLTKERAASLAKNLTVNFNRKGRQARELGALYAFFNASVQGTARMVQTLRGPLGKRIMAGGVSLGALTTLLGMSVMGGGDDDEWEKIPEFVKERSVILPLGRKEYVSLPMPLGFHVLPNIGRLAVEFMLGGPEKTAGRQLGNLLMVMADAFNPMGGAQNAGQMISPTVIDPAVALVQNRDWTGRPIYREDLSSLDPTPGPARTKDSASTFSKVVAEMLNRMSGGTEFRPGAISWSPDAIDYVMGQLTGGLGRELIKLNQAVTAPFTGEELPTHKVPLLGRIYGTTRGASGEGERFYENVREINEMENEVEGNARRGRDVQAILDSEPLAALIGAGNAAETQVRRLRTVRRDVVREGLPGSHAEVRRINEQIGEVMGDLNRQARRARREGVELAR
jgi:hypothetical protein